MQKQGSATNLLSEEQGQLRSFNGSGKEITSMKSHTYKYFAVMMLTAAGLTLAGCQQTPAPASAPATTTTQAPPPSSSSVESTTSKSTEVKPADPANPDAGAVKQTNTESTTVKQKN